MWSDMLVREELMAFLAPLKLKEHGSMLVRLGYEDVDDFANYDDDDVTKLEAECGKAGIPTGHCGKLVRAVRWPP
jgi:hypothetical protein